MHVMRDPGFLLGAGLIDQQVLLAFGAFGAFLKRSQQVTAATQPAGAALWRDTAPCTLGCRSVGWLGLAMAMTVLAVTGLVTTDRERRHGVYRIMQVFDLAL